MLGPGDHHRLGRMRDDGGVGLRARGRHRAATPPRAPRRRPGPPRRSSPRGPRVVGVAALSVLLAGAAVVATARPGSEPAAQARPAPSAAPGPPSAAWASGAAAPRTASPVAPSRAPLVRQAPSQAGVETVVWQGVQRRAVTSRPLGQQGPLPLVLMLHGRASNPHGEQRRTGLSDLAARGAAVVAYPEALGTSWDAGRCCDAATADDSGFLVALVRQLVEENVADPRRVYAVGFSTGAMMALRLACDQPDLLAGVGSVGGVLVADCPATLRVPLIAVHSRLDPLVPLRGTAHSRLGGVALPGVGDVVERWRKRDGCTGRLYAAPVSVVAGTEVRDVAGCPAGGAVRLLLTTAPAHVWPQAADGLDASAALWGFLAQQARV